MFQIFIHTILAELRKPCLCLPKDPAQLLRPCPMPMDTAPANDDSADVLGLDGLEDTNAVKKRRLSGGPHLKKSREEVLQEEVVKLESRVEELVASMHDASAAMPTVATITKVQRSVTQKVTEAKEQGSFDNVTKLEELGKELAVFKDALRMTVLFLPPSGVAKRAHADGFVAALSNLKRATLRRFPEPVLSHYGHLLLTKDRG